MVIDVSQLIEQPVGTVWRYGFTQSGESPVSGTVSLLRTDKGVFVKGTIYTTFKGACSRCLEPLEQTLPVEIEEEYTLQPQECGFSISAGREIDLSEAVRQYSLLAAPMKPLCREDCAGLCSRCGRNLNTGSCGCPTVDIDPRLAKLAMLSSEKEG